jgi:hypothetical protein
MTQFFVPNRFHLNLFIYGLFGGSVNISECISSNDLMIMTVESERV